MRKMGTDDEEGWIGWKIATDDCRPWRWMMKDSDGRNFTDRKGTHVVNLWSNTEDEDLVEITMGQRWR